VAKQEYPEVTPHPQPAPQAIASVSSMASEETNGGVYTGADLLDCSR